MSGPEKTYVTISIPALRNLMLVINITACLFVSMVFAVTSRTICMMEKADDFLSSVVRVPADPRMLFVWSLFICGAFVLSFIIRQIIFTDNMKAVYCTLVIDVVLNVLLLQLNNCNYNGFILWLLASIIYYVEDNWKYPALVCGIFIYMFSSFDLFSVYYPLFSLKDYILYYPQRMQHILSCIFYALSALNLVGFVFFCIQVIREQKNIIAEINRLYNKLARANDKLREYADIKEKMGQTKERNRLAMEIHDTIGHSLTGISVGVDTCIAIMDQNPQAAKTQLQVISGVAKSGIADIRRSVSTLQSDMPKSMALEQNIMDMLDKARKATGIEIIFTSDVQLHFEGDEENAIFRVIQESVTNAIRHGRASRIEVDVSRSGDNLEITVQDNGCGCEKFVSGFGTTHMKERVDMLHGSIAFLPGNGFTVKAVIPLRKEESDD